MRKILPILCAVLISAVNATDIVKDGKPAATIILSPSAVKAARFAAMELQYHIEKMTGVQLPVVTNADKAAGTKIFVGENSMQKNDFSHQEYLIRVKGDTIILMGRDKNDASAFDYRRFDTFPNIHHEQGTCYAVYDFLERLGVRWYLPTDLGIVYQKSSDLNITDLEVRRAPFMKTRFTNPAYQIPDDFAGDTIKTPNTKALDRREAALWYLRQRVGGEDMPINHSFYSWYKRFQETRPEWFAKGYQSAKPPQLCFSNPEVVKQAVQDARDYFDGKPDAWRNYYNTQPAETLNMIPLVPMDNVNWCQCEKCQAQMLSENEVVKGFSSNKASDYVFHFANQVAREIAKTHPGKSVGVLAYWDYCYPPKNIKVEPNVIVCLCLHSRNVYSKPVQENDRKILNAWKEAYPELPKQIWAYYCFPALSATQQQYRCFPGFFAHHLQEQFKRFAEAGVTGFKFEPSYVYYERRSLLMDQLETYVTFKLADDPTRDAGKIIDEFFSGYYGKAAEPMSKMYRIIEDAFCDPANYPATGTYTNEIAWTKLGTEKRMAELGKLMVEAKKLGAGNETVSARLAIFENGIWNYMVKGRETFLKLKTLMAPSMQQSMATYVPNKEPGNPAALNWNEAGYLGTWRGIQAENIERKLSGKIAHDGQFLYLLFEDRTPTDKLVVADAIWGSDEWELYFGLQRGKPYRMFGVDSKERVEAHEFGVVASSIWTPKLKVVSDKKSADIWRLYLAIPLKDLAETAPKPGSTLYFNVIRSHDRKPIGCWIPTFVGYHAPDRFGEIILEKMKK